MISLRLLYFICLLILLMQDASAQKKNATNNVGVYVDKQGVLRWKNSDKEASFFGVNYTVPFAYGYRSHKALNVDLEKAIDNDVYHFSRLGLDAFRVHVWDTEITDSLGNLLENEHLRLFDYLLHKLKERNIKILITPIAFWGNGYPERDERTKGFSSIYPKQKALVNDTAIAAQENYLQQFFKHVNPYTKLTYGNDPDVVAMEINNEPHHSGPKANVTAYVNRMAKAVRSTAWNKPVFYNISESPAHADAVARADVNGYSFQWYPTGLVANRTLQGNYLPNVDLYKIPFGDTIVQYRNKARMVYEFDAGDVLQSNMYPAMARSFRTAGFQWATQFAYDPMATAYANTEYQTHYVNLAYTPSKAISLLIASKVFHTVPRLKSYGTYPADTTFDVFRVSYINSLSEMNAEEEFYYSNATSSQPKNVSALKHVAGVGSSPVVTYAGTGAYFLDKLEDGVWRLEVMPDAIFIRDPFERASPKKEVSNIQWSDQLMFVAMPDLDANFKVTALNENNAYTTTASAGKFIIKPGTYLLTKQASDYNLNTLSAGMKEFVAPLQTSKETIVLHEPQAEVTAGKTFNITATIVGLDTTDKVNVEMRSLSNRWRTLSLQRRSFYDYSAEIPADMVSPGILSYRIIVNKSNKEFMVFPGNHKGDPYAWDAYSNDFYETYVMPQNSALQIFNPTTDRTGISLYNADWRNNTIEYITTGKSRNLVVKATMNKPAANSIFGWQLTFGDKIIGRQGVNEFDRLSITAKANGTSSLKLRIALITANGLSYATFVTLDSTYKTIDVPLTSLQQDSSLLLPRPYPGFLPLWFKAGTTANFNVAGAEKLEISFGYDLPLKNRSTPVGLEIESISLMNGKNGDDKK